MNVPKPIPAFQDCLLSDRHPRMVPDESDLVSMANTFPQLKAASTPSIESFMDVLQCTRENYRTVTSPGLELLDLRLLQCTMILRKRRATVAVDSSAAAAAVDSASATAAVDSAAAAVSASFETESDSDVDDDSDDYDTTVMLPPNIAREIFINGVMNRASAAATAAETVST